jgi:polyisoprenoid-binding protein YceI
MQRTAMISATLLSALCLSAGAASADSYTFDKDHTKIVFVYNHLGMSNQYGRFDGFDGEVEFNAEKMNTGRANVSIDVASIDTDVPKLDEHLRSEEFFDAAKHPKITFKSTEMRQTGAKALQIVGDLTIKGKTRPVVLDATFNYIGEHPLAKFVKAYAGVQYASFSAKTRIRRSEFDVGLYAPLTSDSIDIIIETELRKK